MDLTVKWCFLLTALVVVKAADPTVTITDGVIQGKERQDKNGKTFYSFNSVPYAKPPVGNLRFMDPVAVEKWTGTLEAFTDLTPCYQADYYGMRTGSEDCLYLNVFTPSLSTTSSRPVMVFIHGGGGTGTGREELYDPQFLITQDVVIVVPNFRLGIFGFLSSGKIGNAALKDQVMVLNWIQNNIKQFGGDPSKVTVFGESTGAHATELLVLSPLAKGLFHNAVIQSYTPYGKPSKTENIHQVAADLFPDLTDADEILKELQACEASVLLDAAPALSLTNAVYIEEKSNTAFLVNEPAEIISSGKYNKDVALMFGYNDAEGIAKDQLNLAIYNQHVLVTDFKEMIPGEHLANLNDTAAETLAAQIKKFYYGYSTPHTDDMFPFIKMITDASYAIPTLRSVRKFVASSSRPVYLYKFSADTALNVYKWRIPITGLYKGASHADELGYLFNTIMTPTIAKDSVEDKALSRILKVWGNFARTGNPSESGESWPAVTNSRINYVDIGTEKNEAKVDPDAEDYNFWAENVYAPIGASTSVKGLFLLVVFAVFVALF